MQRALIDTGPGAVGLEAPPVVAVVDSSTRSTRMRASGQAACLGVCGLPDSQMSHLVIIQGER